MPSVSFKPEFSFGNIVTLITLIVSIAGGWTLLSTNVAANTDRIAKLEMVLDAQRTAAGQAQLDLARALTELQTDMRYLRQAVDNLGKQQVNLK